MGLEKGAVAFAALAALTPLLAGAGVHEHAALDHVVVRVGTLGPSPELRTATSEQAIVWLNYAVFPIRVTLGREATTRIHCREPSHFEVTAEGTLRASFVEPLGAASLCLLEPGRYDYRIEELDPAARPPTPLPGGRRFEASLRVTERPSASSTRGDVGRLVRHRKKTARAQREIADVREHLAELQEAAGDPEAAAASRARAAEARTEAEVEEASVRELEKALGGGD